MASCCWIRFPKRAARSVPSAGYCYRAARSVPSVGFCYRAARSVPSAGFCYRAARSVPSAGFCYRAARSVPSAGFCYRAARSVPSAGFWSPASLLGVCLRLDYSLRATARSVHAPNTLVDTTRRWHWRNKRCSLVECSRNRAAFRRVGDIRNQRAPNKITRLTYKCFF